MWGRGQRGNNAACLAQLWVTSPSTHKQIRAFWCLFWVGGFVYILELPWVSPMKSPVRLQVSPTTQPLQVFIARGFWDFISLRWNPGLQGLSLSPAVPPGLSECKCGTTWFASCHLATHPLHPGCLFPPLLPVWMDVYSLNPWLLDFHTVWSSGSSGCVLFLNMLLSFFWLCEEAKFIYLHLHLGWKSHYRAFNIEDK